MTCKEALQSIIEDGIELGAGDYVELEALKIAAEALAKQIPQIPFMRKRVTYNGYCKYIDYYCPVCRKQQKVNFNSSRVQNGWFCEKCGQKLMWEER